MLFKTKRFGAFIHYGIYSQNAWHEQDQLRRRIPKETYIKLQDTFNPTEFNAEDWVKFIKDSGGEYICFTAKHHDGFCMWDTKYTDYNITNTPFKRDLLKELADACKKYNIYLELYYSCPDWHHKNSVNDGSESHKLPIQNEGDDPNEDLYVEYVKNQISELLGGKYGKIHALFWDIPPKRRDTSVNELARSLQPDILINDRGYDLGDYSTPERDACIQNANFDRLCEACQSVGSQAWGYRKDEDYFTPASLISSISSILIKGGNYLLNIGPMPNGKFPEEAMDIYKKCGEWYKKIKESIVDTKFIAIGNFDYTQKENSLYLHLPVGYGCTGAVLSPITTAPKNVIALNTNSPLPYAVEYTPVCYNNDMPSYLHIKNIPSNELIGESIVIRLDFDDINTVFNSLKEHGKIIL